MKKLAILGAIISCSVIIFVGCTENSRAKQFGGTSTINLPPNTKLVIATWKDADLWYLTRPMVSNETAITSTFKEKSRFGLLEGTVNFVESKQ